MPPTIQGPPQTVAVDRRRKVGATVKHLEAWAAGRTPSLCHPVQVAVNGDAPPGEHQLLELCIGPAPASALEIDIERRNLPRIGGKPQDWLVAGPMIRGREILLDVSSTQEWQTLTRAAAYANELGASRIWVRDGGPPPFRRR